MLQRINKTVSITIKLSNGYLWCLLRHNEDCSNKWSKKESIICWLYKKCEINDNDRIVKLNFNNYKEFKIFKDTITK